MLNKTLQKGFFIPAIFSCLFSVFMTQPSYGQYIYGDGSDASDISPLMTAVNSGDVDGVKFFSKAGRSVIDKKNIGGATALHIASRNKNLEIVQILINSGADVNVQDNDKWTPLMRAAANSNPDITLELLKNGANADQKNSVGETAMIHSANSGCFSCLEAVLKYIDYEKVSKYLLDDQFDEAFLIANRKDDSKTKAILTHYKDRIGREDYPSSSELPNLSNNDDLSDIIDVSEDNSGLKDYTLKDQSVLKPVIEESFPILPSDSKKKFKMKNDKSSSMGYLKKDKVQENNDDAVMKDNENGQKIFFFNKEAIDNKEQGNSKETEIDQKRSFFFKRSSKDADEEIMAKEEPVVNKEKENNQKRSFFFKRSSKDEDKEVMAKEEPVVIKKEEGQKKSFFSFFKAKEKMKAEELEDVQKKKFSFKRSSAKENKEISLEGQSSGNKEQSFSFKRIKDLQN